METYNVYYENNCIVDLKKTYNNIHSEMSNIMAKSNQSGVELRDQHQNLEALAIRIVASHNLYLKSNKKTIDNFEVYLSSNPPVRSSLCKVGFAGVAFVSRIEYQPLTDEEISQLMDGIESEYGRLLRKERVEKGANLR